MRSRTFSRLVVVGVAAAIIGVAAGEASAQEQAAGAVNLPAEELGLAPGQPVVVWGDRAQPGEDGYGMFLVLPAGVEVGMHAHTGDYYGINLRGTWVRTVEGDPVEKELPPGSYVFQPGGQFHNDRCAGPDDCVLFLHQHAAGDFIPPPDAP